LLKIDISRKLGLARSWQTNKYPCIIHFASPIDSHKKTIFCSFRSVEAPHHSVTERSRAISTALRGGRAESAILGPVAVPLPQSPTLCSPEPTTTPARDRPVVFASRRCPPAGQRTPAPRPPRLPPTHHAQTEAEKPRASCGQRNHARRRNAAPPRSAFSSFPDMAVAAISTFISLISVILLPVRASDPLQVRRTSCHLSQPRFDSLTS
jgi:hypothetical protein